MRIAAIVLVCCGAAMGAAFPVSSECESCKGLPKTKDIAECSLCQGITTSGSFQICMECSDKRGECQRCRKPLAAAPAEKIDGSRDGTYVSGPWEYRFSIAQKGTRSEGYHGRLLHSGSPVLEPAGINDHYRTPWGPLYWVGQPVTLFGGHGWMMRRLPSRPVGQLLPEPKPAKLTVWAKALVGNTPGAKPIEEPWIREALEGLGVRDPRVERDWFPLGWGSAVLHDTKMYGRASVRLRRSGAREPLVVETRNFDRAGARTEIPRQEGATKLVKHVLSSPMEDLDLYLALRVGSAPGAEGKWMEIGTESDGKAVEVRGVDRVIVNLPGDKATGCSWSVKSIDGGAVQAGGEAEYDPHPDPAGKIGGGIFEVPLRVMGEGKAEVSLEYGRSWQEDRTPEKTFRVTLEVQESPTGAGQDG